MTHNHSGYLFDSNIVIAILDNEDAAINLVRQAKKKNGEYSFRRLRNVKY